MACGGRTGCGGSGYGICGAHVGYNIGCGGGSCGGNSYSSSHPSFHEQHEIDVLNEIQNLKQRLSYLREEQGEVERRLYALTLSTQRTRKPKRMVFYS